MPTETVERLFNTPTPARLKLSNIRGSVKISGHHADTIRVKASILPHSGDADRTEILINQDDDGKVIVTTRYLNDWLFFPGNQKPCKVDYLLWVPEACDLEVSAISNWSEIEDVDGEIEIKTVSGPLNIRTLSGHLKIDSVSAKVQGEFLSGPLKIKSVSGGVLLRNSVITSADISTVSGNVNIQTSLSDGPYHFKSMSGDLIFAVDPNSGCLVEFNTLSGRFKTNFSIDGEKRKSGQRELTLHGGGPEVHFKSISGNLKLYHMDSSNKLYEDKFSRGSMHNPGADQGSFQEGIRDYT